MFRFPSTFTFIFRAFASVDGIGKGLDGDYDFGKLAQPFIERLTADETTPLQRLGSATGLNAEDVAKAVTTPRKIAYIEETMRAMEQGQLKVRVRALENERALERIAAQQATTQSIVIGVAALNTAALIASGPLAVVLYGAAGLAGLQAAMRAIKVRSIDSKNELFTQAEFSSDA